MKATNQNQAITTESGFSEGVSLAKGNTMKHSYIYIVTNNMDKIVNYYDSRAKAVSNIKSNFNVIHGVEFERVTNTEFFSTYYDLSFEILYTINKELLF